MGNAMVYLSAALFALSVFPFHIYNYIYINTEDGYASLNAGVYGINFFNANTVKNNPREMQINGKNRKIEPKKLKGSLYKIFNQICLYKIVQLGDYGLKNQSNAYVALAQSALSTALYKFIQINGNYCKLRNYTILNEEHSEVRYYAKTVTIINLTVVAKIILIILWEKLHELKN